MASEYALRLAFERNRQLTRNDIEWAVGANDQLYLRDKPDWTSHRTLELEQQAERDRQLWKQAQINQGD